ncbi:MAG: hypothetical protein LUE22_06270 [Oscillospiraceae bacterium]|nr:hypothetical protein [Oscillospiraceae bacterium]
MNRDPYDDEFDKYDPLSDLYPEEDDFDPLADLEAEYRPFNQGRDEAVSDEAEEDWDYLLDDELYLLDEEDVPEAEDEEPSEEWEDEPEPPKKAETVSTFDKYFGPEFDDDFGPGPEEQAEALSPAQPETPVKTASSSPAPADKEAAREARFQRRREWSNLRFAALAVGAIAVFYIAVIAYLVFFPRSTISEIENRTLAEFPTFTLATYLSGDYTSDIATWYDDTVPNRDSLKNVGYTFTNLFGLTSSTSSITYINKDVVANDMNAATAEDEEETVEEPVVTEEPDQTDYTAQEAEFDLSNGLLVVYLNGHWRCLGLFGGGGGSAYVEALNTLAEELDDSVTIYSMPAPLASQYYVPSNASSYSSDQEACFESIAERLDSSIISVDICSVLAKHTDEDIYLRTDHHWAPLGAYYAARTFADAAGVPFADLSEYMVGVNQGYVGTMYAYSEDSRILNDPEDFVYYIPMNDYTTYYYDRSFNYQYEGRLIQEVSVSNSYIMFMGGDDKIVKICTDVDNGRKLLVIKDSYGNAEIPFYTSSFEEIFVIDMRYFNCNLVNFIEDLGITDVLFTMCSYSVVGTNANNLSTLLTQNADVEVVDEQAIEAAATPEPTETPAAEETEETVDIEETEG